MQRVKLGAGDVALASDVIPTSVSVREDVVTLVFDYESLAPEVQDDARAAAVRIKRNDRRATLSAAEIGSDLARIKDRLRHGEFGKWVETEFGYSPRTAQQLMNVAVRFEGKSEIISLFSETVAKLLAGPSVPDAAVEQVVTVAQESGRSPQVAEVKRIIAQHKPPTDPDVLLRRASAKTVRYVPAHDDIPPIDDVPVRQVDAPSVVQSSAPASRVTLPTLGKCSVCGRPLSDPDHAANGCGPVCAAKKAGRFVAAEKPDEREWWGGAEVEYATSLLHQIAARWPGMQRFSIDFSTTKDGKLTITLQMWDGQAVHSFEATHLDGCLRKAVLA